MVDYADLMTLAISGVRLWECGYYLMGNDTARLEIRA